MLAAYLFPENSDLLSTLILLLLIALGVFGPPAAFVLIVLKVFRRRREKILALDLERQERADARQLRGGVPTAR